MKHLQDPFVSVNSSPNLQEGMLSEIKLMIAEAALVRSLRSPENELANHFVIAILEAGDEGRV